MPSKDGKVKIPMFIVHRNDVKLDGTNPAYLYAYGGESACPSGICSIAIAPPRHL